ncbi:MAG: glycosyltransferase [Paenibacillus lautus]|jgi:cellulose synthase/poly-beta-1,6-N-acetylglucosamine synthase-like glycosyltransferase|uniref:glycosyltransferase family 2 protein n=1 Tax=Paenibacillus lautus TaxID=1401 RepID=UPI0026F2E8CE|nr:glycosyltransferase family 2 protein [Paenibacillus lautus]MCI1773935.1 glycosyltransferase [Paenibacillus lautus]
MKMTISIVVPTFNRVESLSKCIEGLLNQKKPADEIIVVIRDEDTVTQQYLSTLNVNKLKIIYVDLPGQVAALNMGIRAASSSIIAITDDDTIPHSDWIEKITRHFEQDSSIGGVGGRDVVYHRGLPVEACKKTVGKIMPFGRVIGNHHIGLGDVRRVHILKGANMSFRAEALKGMEFDSRLKGAGAQVHNDMEFSLSVRSKGWKLIYDPLVCVNHYPAERFDEDRRNSFNPVASFNTSHNEMYILLKHSNWINRVLVTGWVILVGSKPSPGFLQFIRQLPSEKMISVKKIINSYKGRVEGWRTWRLSRSTEKWMEERS